MLFISLARSTVEVIRALQVILIGGQDPRWPFIFIIFGVGLLAREDHNVCSSGKFVPDKKSLKA